MLIIANYCYNVLVTNIHMYIAIAITANSSNSEFVCTDVDGLFYEVSYTTMSLTYVCCVYLANKLARYVLANLFIFIHLKYITVCMHG